MIGEFKQDVKVDLPGANPYGAPLIAHTLNQIYRAELEMKKLERSHVAGCLGDHSDYDFASAVREPVTDTIYVGRQ